MANTAERLRLELVTLIDEGYQLLNSATQWDDKNLFEINHKYQGWYSRSLLICVGVWPLMAVAACVTLPDQTTWIRVGNTTEKEIVARYGDPDLTQVSATGKVVTYQSTAQKITLPPPEIPTVTPGPLGRTVTKMEPIWRPPRAQSAAEWIQKEIRIRYDEHEVVQEILP